MPLDPDILAAADLLALERIEAQTDRNDATSKKAYREGLLKVAQDRQTAEATAASKQQANFDGLVPELTYRQQIILALIPKYITPSTSTVTATWDADMLADVAKIAKAADAIVNA